MTAAAPPPASEPNATWVPTQARTAPPAAAAMVALQGERLLIDGRAGPLHVYAQSPLTDAGNPGTQRPLLLIHSINASASAAEVKPLYDHAGRTRAVYAPDLPGYGLSDRSDRDYTIRLMTDAVHDALDLIAARHGAVAVDAMALSLSCEYLARAAVEAPQRFSRLVFVSPTGFSGSKRRHGPVGTALGPPWLPRLLEGPGWGRGLFALLTRPGVIRYFLQRTWGSKQIDEALWHYDLITTREPGARHAPLRFLSAALFSADVNTLYEQLPHPVWMACGTRGDFSDFGGAKPLLLQQQTKWRQTVYPETGALMYFEQPAAFCGDMDAFLGAAAV